MIVPKYMFRGNSNFIKFWDLFIIILALYNAIFIPIELSFAPLRFSGIWYTIVDASVDFCFLLDIIITFRTTFIEFEQGKEITDEMEIAREYLTGRFAIDLVSTLPFSSMASDSVIGGQGKKLLDGLGFLKILRLSRLPEFITNLNTDASVKVMLKILTLVIYLMVFCQVWCCLWFLITDGDETWFMNMDFIWVG